MIFTPLLLLSAGLSPNTGPTAEELFQLIQRAQFAFASAIESEGGSPDRTYSIEKIVSYRCVKVYAARQRCKVSYKSPLGRIVRISLVIEKSDGIWTKVDLPNQ